MLDVLKPLTESALVPKGKGTSVNWLQTVSNSKIINDICSLSRTISSIQSNSF